MALDFDDPPIYDLLIQTHGSLSPIWSNWMSGFITNLQQYLSQNGIFVPKLSTFQRDQLQNVIDGQIIYNITLGKFQGRESGNWLTFTLI